MTRHVDLSHPIASGIRGYPGLPAPRIEAHISHLASRPTYAGAAEFEITRVFMVGNSGTYLDSPYHRFAGSTDIAGLPLAALAGLPGRVIEAQVHDRRIDVRLDPDDDLEGAAVLVQTGWDRHWGSDHYWRPAPFVTGRLAERLVALGVGLVGIDSWNVDDVEDPARPVHTTLLGAGIPIVEHLTGLDLLPRRGFRFSAVPAPVVGAASMPVRAYAELEDPVGDI